MNMLLKKLKLFFKRIVVIICIFCILLPSLFSGVVFGINDWANTPLTQERAGNYAANFAINFYENWSSINVVEGSTTTSSNTQGSGAILEEAAKLFAKIVRDNPEYNGNESLSGLIDDGNVRNVDCSAFVSAVIYNATGAEEFKHQWGVSEYYQSYSSNILNNTIYKIAEKYGWKVIYDADGSMDTSVLQPGDIVMYNHGDIGHTAVFVEAIDSHYYKAYDCGDDSNWREDIANKSDPSTYAHGKIRLYLGKCRFSSY